MGSGRAEEKGGCREGRWEVYLLQKLWEERGEKARIWSRRRKRGEVGEEFVERGVGRRVSNLLLRDYETVEVVGILRPNGKIYEFFCFFRAVLHISLTFFGLYV